MAAARVRKQVEFDEELWRRVEAFRFAQRMRSEAEAIRELVMRGLSGEADAKAA